MVDNNDVDAAVQKRIQNQSQEISQFTNLIQSESEKRDFFGPSHGSDDPISASGQDLRAQQRELLSNLDNKIGSEHIDEGVLAEMIHYNLQLNGGDATLNRRPSADPAAPSFNLSTIPPAPSVIDETSLQTVAMNGVLLRLGVCRKLVKLFSQGGLDHLERDEYVSMVRFVYSMQHSFQKVDKDASEYLRTRQDFAAVAAHSQLRLDSEAVAMFWRKYAHPEGTVSFTSFLEVACDVCLIRNRMHWSGASEDQMLQLDFDQFLGLTFGESAGDFI
eukprot:TRINITY_DN6178_c0_g1_i1.p1 TRINITY_DN6178_c0_g1~~TRINITY_DN6178_c0_g1_i1.p1  ORF type:complete len:275 (-),score=70.69 TRINITY_DN6178_c0_g1_i1:77-901(-)